MTLQQRYQQATKEARWALGLTLLYVIGWCLCAYLPKATLGLIGFPLWFELACIYLPILFIVVAYWLIKIVFQDIPLDVEEKKQHSTTERHQ